MPTALELNARDLELELAWFTQVLDARFKAYFSEEAVGDVFAIAPPDLSASESPYARFIQHYAPTFGERLAVVLGLVPHIRPRLLDVFFTKPCVGLLRENYADRQISTGNGQAFVWCLAAAAILAIGYSPNPYFFP